MENLRFFAFGLELEKRFMPACDMRLIHKILLAMLTTTMLALLLNAAISRHLLGGGFEAFIQQADEQRLISRMDDLQKLYDPQLGWDCLLYTSPSPRD